MEAIGDGTSAIPVDEETGGLTVEEMELEQQLLKVFHQLIHTNWLLYKFIITFCFTNIMM